MKTRTARKTRGSRRTVRLRVRGSAARAGSRRAKSSSQRRNTGRRSAALTTDHNEIRRWVEERGGHPATVQRSARMNQPAGILRIDFPGFSGGRSLKAVSWEEWFRIFDERRLGFLHQDRTAAGKPSRFNKLVCRE